MGKADLGFAVEFVQQPVYVAGDEISAITNISRLVPCEERVKRRPRGEGVRVERRRERPSEGTEYDAHETCRTQPLTGHAVQGSPMTQIALSEAVPDWGIVAPPRSCRKSRCSKPRPAGSASRSTHSRPERLSPLLNLGSSSAEVRNAVQPWIERDFRPLRDRGRRDRPCRYAAIAGRRYPGRSDR